jgi:hypothetical protein
MSKLREEGFTISLDGFGAGLDQYLINPLGMDGTSLRGCERYGVGSFNASISREFKLDSIEAQTLNSRTSID